MKKPQFKDYITIYVYQSLSKLLKIIPQFSKYNIIFISEGEFIDIMEEQEKSKFYKSLLSLQNIDDRFTVEWNNIRIINKNEKTIQDFLLIKDSMSGQEKNFISLNINNDNGINVIGTENTHENNKEYLNGPTDVTGNPTGDAGYTIDNILNPYQDGSKTSVQIKKGESKENVYSQNINILSLNNVEDSFNNELNKELAKGAITRRKEKYFGYEDNLLDVKAGVFLEKSGQNVKNSTQVVGPSFETLSINSKYKKFLDDPVVKKLQNYLKEKKQLETQ